MARTQWLLGALLAGIAFAGCMGPPDDRSIGFAVDETQDRFEVMWVNGIQEWDDYGLRLAGPGSAAVGGPPGSHNNRGTTDGSQLLASDGVLPVDEAGADLNGGSWVEFCAPAATSTPPTIQVVHLPTGEEVFEGTFASLHACAVTPMAAFGLQASSPPVDAPDASRGGVPVAAYAGVAILGIAVPTTLAAPFALRSHPRWLWKAAALIGGFSRFRRDELLDQRRRQTIHDAVRASPGASASQIRRRLEMTGTTFFYHVRRLEGARLLHVKRSGGQLYLFETARTDFAIPHALDERILQFTENAEGRTLTALAIQTSASPSTVLRRLRVLEAAGQLERLRRSARDIRWRRKAGHAA